MNYTEGINSTTAAFIAGLLTSLHCVGMCGPLACGVVVSKTSELARNVAAGLYHLGRLCSYALVGALCGAVGQQPLKWVFNSPAVILPWLLVLLFLAMAFKLEKKIPRPRWLDKIVARVRLRLFSGKALSGALILGLLTPLLPCTPLYVLFGTALASGSYLHGIQFTMAFALGTIPLLWVTQFQMNLLRKRFGPRVLEYTQRSLALVTALMLIWRLWDTLTPTGALPSCCH